MSSTNIVVSEIISVTGNPQLLMSDVLKPPNSPPPSWRILVTLFLKPF